MDKKQNNITEGMFSTIDQIRQDSKDVRDFVKKVFADREFKKMSNDKDFIKYLKSIYEGTLLDEEAVAVSTRSADGTITTRIKEDIINEVKYYITRNQGRGRGKSLVGGYDLKKNKKLPPKEFRTFKDAEKEIKRLQNTQKGIPGGGSAYFVTDKKMNPLKESVINEGNRFFNKWLLKYVDSGIGGDYKKGSPEYLWWMAEMFREALSDANFHSEAKKIKSIFSKAKQPKPRPSSLTGKMIQPKSGGGVSTRAGQEIANKAKLDGHDIIDGFSFVANMRIGGKFGDKFQSLKNESINEGQKRYNQKDGVGKSKYVISYHDGKKKHKDGSDFFDIQIFRNKKDLAKFVNSLHKGGYKYGFGESINEASREAMGIAGFTGTRGSAVQKFIDDYNLNSRKLFNFVKKGKLKDRMDFVTAIAGKPGNKFQGKMVGMFGEGKDDGVPQGYNPMVESKTKESKVVQMIYKYEKKEKKFYDKMAEHEKRIGVREYGKFIINALRGFGINPREFKRVPDAEEKLYQTVSKK